MAPPDCLGCNRSYPGDGVETSRGIWAGNALTASRHCGRFHFALHLSSAARASVCVFRRRLIQCPNPVRWPCRHVMDFCCRTSCAPFAEPRWPLQSRAGALWACLGVSRPAPVFLGTNASSAGPSIPALDCGIAGGLSRPLHTLAAFFPSARPFLWPAGCQQGTVQMGIQPLPCRATERASASGHAPCGIPALRPPRQCAGSSAQCVVHPPVMCRRGAVVPPPSPRSAPVALAAMRRCALFFHAFCGLIETAGAVGAVCTSLF